jgi:AraC-like DNA-binding protein
MAISMDGKGSWRDNVFIERLWRSIKCEEVYLRAYDTVSDARADCAYLRSIRLAAVCDELTMPNNASSIAEIAHQWVFAHLGRFSASYRKTYGELPSVAPRRGKGESRRSWPPASSWGRQPLRC